MTVKMKCIVVDDEPIARDYLSAYVQKMPQLELLGCYSNAMDAFPVIEEGHIDLIFLDIQMPGLTGLEFLRTLQSRPEVILTTAYSEYALEGFELEVADYLLKPISFERFAKAVKKVERRKLPQPSATTITSEEMPERVSNAHEFMFVKSGYKSVKVLFDEILYIEGLKEYVLIRTKEGKFTKLDRMKNLEQNLSNKGFIRIHKSYIVSVSAIQSVFGNTIELTDGSKLPIGRVYKNKIEILLGLNN